MSICFQSSQGGRRCRLMRRAMESNVGVRKTLCLPLDWHLRMHWYYSTHRSERMIQHAGNDRSKDSTTKETGTLSLSLKINRKLTVMNFFSIQSTFGTRYAYPSLGSNVNPKKSFCRCLVSMYLYPFWIVSYIVGATI